MSEEERMPDIEPTDIAVRDIAPPVPGQNEPSPPSMLNFIALALRDPAIDVEKLRALLGMQKELLADEARAKFDAAMAAAQSEMQPVVRNKKNDQTHSNYADLRAVDDAIRSIYTAHGFSLSFTERPTGNELMEIVCLVSHSPAPGQLGDKREYAFFAPPDTIGPKGSPTKTSLHGRASTNTFLKRQIISNVFNLAFRDEDDDGNRGGAQFITEEQADRIEKLILETKADRPRFMQHFGLASLLNMRAEEFPAAVNMLELKARKLKSGTDAR